MTDLLWQVEASAARVAADPTPVGTTGRVITTGSGASVTDRNGGIGLNVSAAVGSVTVRSAFARSGRLRHFSADVAPRANATNREYEWGLMDDAGEHGAFFRFADGVLYRVTRVTPTAGTTVESAVAITPTGDVLDRMREYAVHLDAEEARFCVDGQDMGAMSSPPNPNTTDARLAAAARAATLAAASGDARLDVQSLELRGELGGVLAGVSPAAAALLGADGSRLMSAAGYAESVGGIAGPLWLLAMDVDAAPLDGEDRIVWAAPLGDIGSNATREAQVIFGAAPARFINGIGLGVSTSRTTYQTPASGSFLLTATYR